MCAGFYVSYNNSSLEPNITASVRKMAAAHPGTPLYVIGHSMGAALATICAMDVKFKAGLSDVRLYTFGSPRVGNDVFASFVANQTTVRAKPGQAPPALLCTCGAQVGRMGGRTLRSRGPCAAAAGAPASTCPSRWRSGPCTQAVCPGRITLSGSVRKTGTGPQAQCAAICSTTVPVCSMQAHWRFTHNRDIVPSWPPTWVGFHHLPREVWQVDFGAAGVRSPRLHTPQHRCLCCGGAAPVPVMLHEVQQPWLCTPFCRFLMLRRQLQDAWEPHSAQCCSLKHGATHWGLEAWLGHAACQSW